MTCTTWVSLDRAISLKLLTKNIPPKTKAPPSQERFYFIGLAIKVAFHVRGVCREVNTKNLKLIYRGQGRGLDHCQDFFQFSSLVSYPCLFSDPRQPENLRVSIRRRETRFTSEQIKIHLFRNFKISEFLRNEIYGQKGIRVATHPGQSQQWLAKVTLIH